MTTREPRSVDELLALARDAVASALADLHRTTSTRPEVIVDLWMNNAVRISVDGSYTTPSMFATSGAAAVAEVAGYLQEQLAPNLGVWPVCGEHHVGVHPEVHAGKAVWFCRLGQHEVSPIGDLGAESSRRP